MKGLIQVAFFFLVFVCVGDYLEKGRIDLLDSLKSNISLNDSASNNDIVVNEHHDNNNSHEHPQKSETINNTIVIRPLGNVDEGDMNFAINTIKDFYGFDVIVKSNVDITNPMLGNNGELSSVNACFELNSNEKTVYITDRLIYGYEGDLLRGAASHNGMTVLVRGEISFMRETIIHELGHTFGLDHCSDLTCVMAVKNDAWDSGDFCNKCKKQIGR